MIKFRRQVWILIYQNREEIKNRGKGVGKGAGWECIFQVTFDFVT